MTDFSFRYRFRLAPRSFILIDEMRFELSFNLFGQPLFLSAINNTTPIKEAKDLVLHSSGWLSEEAASSAGLKLADCLSIALVKHRIGRRPSSTIPRGRFVNLGLANMKAVLGKKVVGDHFGLTVFPSDPQLEFASLETNLGRGVAGTQFLSSFGSFASIEPTLTPQDQIAIDFFNLSFLQQSDSIRLICLVTAIESLIEERPRHKEAVQLVKLFIQQTEANNLPAEEKDSLLGSLRYLLNESISRGGASLARERLGDEEYHGKKPDKFFSECYSLRSRLVHGHNPPPTEGELEDYTAELELFVSELIVAPYNKAA